MGGSLPGCTFTVPRTGGRCCDPKISDTLATQGSAKAPKGLALSPLSLGSRLSASGRDGSPPGGRPDSLADRRPHSHSLERRCCNTHCHKLRSRRRQRLFRKLRGDKPFGGRLQRSRALAVVLLAAADAALTLFGSGTAHFHIGGRRRRARFSRRRFERRGRTLVDPGGDHVAGEGRVPRRLRPVPRCLWIRRHKALERIVPNDTTAGRLTSPCGPFLWKLGAFWRLCFGHAMIMTRRKIAWSSR